MADPPIIQDPAATQAAIDANTNYIASNEAVARTNERVANTSTTVATNLGVINDQSLLTSKGLGVLTAVTIGTNDAFSNFGNIDKEKIATFGKSIDELTNNLTRSGTAVGTVTSGIESLKGVIARMGGNNEGLRNMFPNAAKNTAELIAQLGSYAKMVLLVADDHLKLQGSMVQQAAAVGTLGDLYSKVGYDLSTFNEASIKQADVIANVSKITKLNEGVIAGYAGQLNTVPGVMDNLLKSTDKNSAAATLFARSVEYAIGSGRKYSDVVQDMNLAYKGFGLSQEEAFKYTGRMSEAADILKIPIDDLRTSLNSSSDAFKMYSDGGAGAIKMTEGLQQSMVDYMQSLKDVGVPMQGQIELANEMSGAVGKMNIAQKAYLSGQTGGAGGLMGAFQIDKMMRDGDIKGVMDKVKQSMQKQLGSIVTVDEAAKSQGAAAQMTRQIQMLKGGPLGNFAKTDAEAERLLDMMKKGQTPGNIPGAATQFGTKDSMTQQKLMEQGVKISQDSYSVLDQINATLNEMRVGAGAKSLGAAQMLTARSGEHLGTGENEPTKNQQSLRNFQQSAITPSETSSSIQAMKDLSGMPHALSLAAQGFIQALSGGNPEQIKIHFKDIQQRSAELSAQASHLPELQRKAQTSLADTVSNLANKAVQEFSGVKDDKTSFNSNLNSDDYVPVGKQVGRAIPKGKTGAAAGDQSFHPVGVSHGLSHQDNARNNGPVPVTLVGSSLTVNFTGKCPHCGTNIQDTGHATVLNAASTASH